MDSSLLNPLSRGDLVQEWKAASQAALGAERDWLILSASRRKYGGPPPDESLRIRCETLRRIADGLRKQLWGW